MCEVCIYTLLLLCCMCACVQVFWYFPLKPQLESLLKNERFRHLLMHESRRGKNQKYVSDVFDTPRWRKVAGEPTEKLERVVYQICIDAFPWTSRKHAVIVCLFYL